MAKTKENFKSMNTDELTKKLSTLSEDLRVLHFRSEGAKSKNVKEGATLRKQIARILTEINSQPNSQVTK